jgi:S-adenosylmethionine:tRNA ribosyltransferase-isomerase
MPSLSKTLTLSDFDYILPEQLIAQKPADKRDSSRLMIVDKTSGNIQHKIFSDILSEITPDDVLVMNDTMVIPARLSGKKYGGTARLEVLLDRRLNENVWEALVRPLKRVDIGTVIEFAPGFFAEVLDVLDEGKAVLHFASIDNIYSNLNKLGATPLPPYINASKDREASNSLSERYQTIYASKKGATAAPTAGLHFTPELLKDIPATKVFVTLHTGYGTFAPVRTDDVTLHRMHKESFEISGDAFGSIIAAKKDGRRVIAVGTTTARLLESMTGPGRGETDIFIYPGYQFKIVDAMVTNFHLPKSTLMMLVSAFGGHELLMKAYKEAVESSYRFFSFGDAMFIK